MQNVKSTYVVFTLVTPSICRMMNDDEWANCGICCQAYTVEGVHMPRMLPCSHEVCTQCITAIFDGHEVQCPFCRDKFALRLAPGNGAAVPATGFPAARRLIQHLQKVLDTNCDMAVPLNICSIFVVHYMLHFMVSCCESQKQHVLTSKEYSKSVIFITLLQLL